MKFQRRLSEPHVVLVEESPVRRAWEKTGWQRLSCLLPKKEFWTYLLNLATGSTEPIIEEQDNAKGDTCYTIYDPVTQQRVEGLSEAETRVWLEQRYYQ